MINLSLNLSHSLLTPSLTQRTMLSKKYKLLFHHQLDKLISNLKSLGSTFQLREGNRLSNIRILTGRQSNKTLRHSGLLLCYVNYVPITKRNEGKSPFFVDEDLVLESLQELTLPVTKITKPALSCQPFKGFARPSQSPIIEHGSFLQSTPKRVLTQTLKTYR